LLRPHRVRDIPFLADFLCQAKKSRLRKGNILHYAGSKERDTLDKIGTAGESRRFFFNFARKIKALGRILAIDYGSKRSGVAVTDPGQRFASPLETVLSHELMNFLKDYVEKETVDLLVVGQPWQMDHTESESMKQIRFFVQAFKKRFAGIPVKWVDERFTSKLAMDALVAGGMKKSERRAKGNLDKVSAAIILQSYLDTKTISGDKR
jgi:putative Holliday junction resolvase